MLKFKTTDGRILEFEDKPLGQGGEGAVYKQYDKDGHGDIGDLAKIFNAGKREGKEEKLKAMMKLKSPQPSYCYVWPKELLYDNESGEFCGYVMYLKYNKIEIGEVYGYNSQYRTERNWRYFVDAAKNLAQAVMGVHEINQVIGDLNDKNILIDTATCQITLIDNDSFHITDGSETHRCGVGKSEYIASEIQNVKFSTAEFPTFTKHTDTFSLAILIFKLLMNGAHPFNSVGQNENSIEDNINIGAFSYFAKSMNEEVNTAFYAPSIWMLPDKLIDLFKRSFIHGVKFPDKRPSAQDYFNELEKLSKKENLKTCTKEDWHIFPKLEFNHMTSIGSNTKNECPWCEVEVKKTKQLEKIAALSTFSANNAADYAVPKPPPLPPKPNTIQMDLGSSASSKSEKKTAPEPAKPTPTALPKPVMKPPAAKVAAKSPPPPSSKPITVTNEALSKSATPEQTSIKKRFVFAAAGIVALLVIAGVVFSGILDGDKPDTVPAGGNDTDNRATGNVYPNCIICEEEDCDCYPTPSDCATDCDCAYCTGEIERPTDDGTVSPDGTTRKKKNQGKTDSPDSTTRRGAPTVQGGTTRRGEPTSRNGTTSKGGGGGNNPSRTTTRSSSGPERTTSRTTTSTSRPTTTPARVDTLSWSVNASDTFVRRVGSGNHVLVLSNPRIAGAVANGTLTVNYASGQSAGSNRRIIVWTDLVGGDNFSFATRANLDANRIARTHPRLTSSDTRGTITIPGNLLYSGGSAATRIYVLITTDANGSDYSSSDVQRGGGTNNEFNRLGTITLSLN